MTIIFLQPDGVPATAQQERQGRAAQHGGGAGRPLGGRSGFRVDTSADTLTATSAAWTLKPCSAELDPGASTHQGMYGWATDANITGPITPSDQNYARKDIVYIQVNDSSAGDGTTGTPSAPVLYLAGNPLTGNAPALPPRSFLVGTINVPKTGGGAPTVTLNPARYVAAGGILPVDQAARDALAAYDGLVIERTDVPGRPLERYDGANWWRSGGPHAMHADVKPIGEVSANNTPVPLPQTFPAGKFSVPPVVTVTTDQSRIIAVPGGITKDGFNLYLQNVTGSKSNNGFVSWTAVQMTPTSATG